jgi:hypothetical protein
MVTHIEAEKAAGGLERWIYLTLGACIADRSFLTQLQEILNVTRRVFSPQQERIIHALMQGEDSTLAAVLHDIWPCVPHATTEPADLLFDRLRRFCVRDVLKNTLTSLPQVIDRRPEIIVEKLERALEHARIYESDG